jgi:rhodanese-related sulfurtransferase
LDAISAAARLDELQIVDVREPFELEEGHIPGAVNIPLYELPYRLGQIDIDRTVLVVCETGDRSSDADSMLRANGYDSHNLEGGMWGWRLRHLPLECPGTSM